ncbi:MAG: (d)CMP kinase [Bacteroidetes bacterium]|nr:(d)CMP kinase [Bacteroidota bacterium]
MSERKKIIVAIDGYSSCGKSTLAKAIAKYLHYNYIDSGAMYRAVTLHMLHKNMVVAELNAMNPEEMKVFLNEIKITFHLSPETKLSEIYLNGVNVDNEIRTMGISDLVSPVSAISAVRKRMVEKQQFYGGHRGIVMDGRDIGTTVFPDAELKIFMTADKEVRAKRRYEELRAKGYRLTLDEVYQNIASRDQQDTSRSESPLRQANDAIVLDNSDLNENEQMAIALEWVNQAIEA